MFSNWCLNLQNIKFYLKQRFTSESWIKKADRKKRNAYFSDSKLHLAIINQCMLYDKFFNILSGTFTTFW